MVSQLQKLSPRERKLALAVVLLMAGGLIVILTHRALARIQELDQAIAQRQDTLIAYTRLLARSQSVDEAYARVAAQHSSAWTEAEIHDRLRQEIYRLAMKNPPPIGTPFSPSKSDILVSIPVLRQGTLKTGEEGYREYQLNIKLPGTTVDNIFTFLERLQGSDQSLRIDGLRLTRSPTQELVSAVIDVTRTVVDDPSETSREDIGSYIPKTWPELGTLLDDWQWEGCELSQVPQYVTRGTDSLKVHASVPGATLFLREELDTGMTHELSLDIIAFGPARIDVMNEANGALYKGAAEVISDGQLRQYQLRFAVPAMREPRTRLRLPLITLIEEGSEVYIDNVMVKKSMG